MRPAPSPDVEPFNIVPVGWYLSPLGLLLGVIGCALLVYKHAPPSRLYRALLGVGVLLFTVLYTYKTYNNPHHIYVMRRYVPAAFPMLTLGLAYALDRLADWNLIGRVSAIGLAVISIVLLIDAGRVSNPQIDYAGGLDQYRVFAPQIPADAIVLFDDREVVGVTALFGTPLAYLDQHTVLDLQEDKLLDMARLGAILKGWQAAGRSVVVVNGPQTSDQVCTYWQCHSLGTAHFDWPTLEASYVHFPTKIDHPTYDLTLLMVNPVR